MITAPGPVTRQPEPDRPSAAQLLPDTRGENISAGQFQENNRYELNISQQWHDMNITL